MFHALRFMTLLFLDFKHSLTLKFTCRYFARDPTLAKQTSKEAWRESRELRALELEERVEDDIVLVLLQEAVLEAFSGVHRFARLGLRGRNLAHLLA